MQRVCFLLQVKADRLAEYKRLHKAVWPEKRLQLLILPPGALEM